MDYTVTFTSLWVCVFQSSHEDSETEARPLAESLLLAISNLLFCPDFTVQTHKKSGLVSVSSFRRNVSDVSNVVK